MLLKIKKKQTNKIGKFTKGGGGGPFPTHCFLNWGGQKSEIGNFRQIFQFFFCAWPEVFAGSSCRLQPGRQWSSWDGYVQYEEDDEDEDGEDGEDGEGVKVRGEGVVENVDEQFVQEWEEDVLATIGKL